ncbi:hypothetical protein ON010_g6203 [Phytophthora cinnamomi]|nr:hypothetical protein ON010_g6203 [Phytophthora cinnamomi]
MQNGLATDSSVTTHSGSTPMRFQTAAPASKDASVSAAVTCRSTTSTCSPNTAIAVTSSGVAATSTTAKDVNTSATPSSKPTNCTPVLDDTCDVSQTTDKPRPCSKGANCTSGADSTPTPPVAPGAKETAIDCISVLAADEQSGVLAIDEEIATNARRYITALYVRDTCISTRTQRTYAGSLRTISRWNISTKNSETRHCFDNSGQIDLSRFTSQEFEEFLV